MILTAKKAFYTLIKEYFPNMLGGYTKEEQKQEYQFHPERKWKFDLADPELMIAFEYEGGAYTKGSHYRAKGFTNDLEKYNTATSMGWQVYRFNVVSFDSGHVNKTIEMLENLRSHYELSMKWRQLNKRLAMKLFESMKRLYSTEDENNKGKE
jgi:hypothetical protein